MTSKTFYNLGMRTMPIGKPDCIMTRDKNGKKLIQTADGSTLSFAQAMPANWTNEYGAQRKDHADTPLGGLICGQLDHRSAEEIEVVALDCDNALAWDMVRSMDPNYSFHFKSVGKEGGTILYELCDELRDIPQYSINNGVINFEYMARRESGANAMVYLPTTANRTKEPIPSGAELNTAPKPIVALIKSLQLQKPLAAPIIDESASRALLPFNAPLVKQYILESKANSENNAFGFVEDSPVAQKIYTIFTPKNFRQLQAYKDQGWLSPNDDTLTQAGPYSEYIVGVSAIAGADPSIDSELYMDFMQAINAQLDDPMPADRYFTEVLHPMIHKQSKINNKPIWQYNENWDANSHSISNQRGETLEYFVAEHLANTFYEYNHTTKSLVIVAGLSALLDRIYAMDADPQQEKPNRNLVKKLKLAMLENSVRYEPGIFVNSKGYTVINGAEATLPLRILRNPDIFPEAVTKNNLYVQAFETFMHHLLGDDDQSKKFMRQLLAYHGRHLKDIPVIIYMVGVGGAGKSQFSNILEALFGANTTRRPSAKQLSGQFNDFLENCALLVLSETSDVSVRDRQGLKSVLKTVTGEKAIDVEAKGKPMRPNVPVFALPLMLANDLWYQEDSADRRIFAISPTDPLHKSQIVREFETANGIKIVDFIIEGIKKGYISKYLAGFCPNKLPEVPLTLTKAEFVSSQDDLIAQVKSIVFTQQFDKLFDLCEEYDISGVFTLLERNITPQSIYSGTLVDLVKAMREGGNYPYDRDIRKAFTGPRWPEMKDFYKRNTSGSGVASYKKVGIHRWQFEVGIHSDILSEAYEKWKLDKLVHGDDDE
jgi:hypothetical protein